VPPIARTPLAVVGSMVALNVSMMSLKKKGTCTLRSCRSTQARQHADRKSRACERTLPPMRRPTASSTRVFVPQSCLGQTLGSNVLIISQSFLPCSFSET
jgi:hypothetical protein